MIPTTFCLVFLQMSHLRKFTINTTWFPEIRNTDGMLLIERPAKAFKYTITFIRCCRPIRIITCIQKNICEKKLTLGKCTFITKLDACWMITQSINVTWYTPWRPKSAFPKLRYRSKLALGVNFGKNELFMC